MINDLTVSNASIWKYVKDTTTSEVIKKGQHSEAQGIVNEVVNWSIRNRVKLNTDKCKELRISFTSDFDFPPVVIGEEYIKLVKDAKLLGVTISGDLTWNAHITEVTKKAAKRLYFLVQLKKLVFHGKIYAFFTSHACAPSLTMLRQFSITSYQPTFRKN